MKLIQTQQKYRAVAGLTIHRHPRAASPKLATAFFMEIIQGETRLNG